MPRFQPIRIRHVPRIVLALALAQGASLPAPTPANAASSPEICPERLTVSREGSDLVVPYCANRLLNARDESVQRAVIVIHGDSRNAADYFRYVSRAATDSGVAAGTLILAPQFLLPDELPGAGLDATGLYWTPDNWKDGAESGTSPISRPSHISSFGVVDTLVKAISDRTLYPNLSEVVILGHSAGGQFVNRYSAATTVEQSLSTTGIRFRYVVANPSTLLYLDTERWEAGAAGQFSPLSTAQRSACSGFNRYKFGLEEPNPYVAAVGSDAIRAQFRLRSVVYLLGDLDTSTSDPTMSNGCEARWQGASRFERGTRYVSYLRHFYGDAGSSSHRQVIVPGVGHDAQAMFRSPSGRQVLFGGSSPIVVRRAGSDRYATAAAVSKATFTSATVVHVATGLDYPDALAAAAAAGARGGPVLLVDRNTLPASTASELLRLGPDQIVVVGGTAVVSSAVEQQLRTITGASVVRRAGSDRYATAAAVSKATFASATVVHVATGLDYPDALAAAAAAGARGGPVLLVDRNALPAATATELARLGPDQVVVVGGTAVVSSAVEQQLRTR